jgi:hypothetical protein
MAVTCNDPPGGLSGKRAGHHKGVRKIQDFRTIKFDIAGIQRAIAARNGRMAMRYATSTISNNPNIARMATKFGESSAKNTAGTDVTIAKIFSPIQSSIAFLASLQRQIVILIGRGRFDLIKSCGSSHRPLGS